MRFLYGYVPSASGEKRFGWMAEEALHVEANGCK